MARNLDHLLEQLLEINASWQQLAASDSFAGMTLVELQAATAQSKTRRLEGVGYASKDAFAGVVDRRGFAVHQAIGADDLAAVDLADEEVALVQNKLNSRPRKCLDYATPNDIFTAPPPIALAA